MADYSVTAANVLASNYAKRFQPNVVSPLSALAVSARPGVNVAGAAITAGQPVYQDPTTFAFHPADANGADPLYKVVGMAETSAAIGQGFNIITEDPYYTPGCTMLVGDVIILSATAGGIAPASDAASGMVIQFLMVAYSTTQARLYPIRSDVAKA